ncbi:MAG: type 2 isopentenyl-diphosphate Delta-isomerase [Candidatus Diapherotrites archaeon]|jgi:isopentenyl-diphosphate Delta-isomerase|uniref:Isopentenyl-diphosphate delta-isomerase n=1 Tax=Candidatus Iainarchaeum sp. TaxID=3101447 RepID=A0A8T5GGX2_9ARCH|nr:type 2 isopentenyl-diphosphate Delta-isomerase [Candidatus Diapherotrites archaeon]MBT7241136.1 type 2 isopentenyl-diphosphate Delta-isomerase [Candidatus Diapherotrites archaeon]
MVSQTEKRKVDHIKLCVEKDVAFKEKTTLLECVELDYKTLPEIALDDVNLETEFLGKTFSTPLMVSAITGGSQISKKINQDIAKACQELGIGMGLGSMRAMIESPSIADTYYVRDVAPDIFLAGNIGAAQLREYSPEIINKALESVGADALAIHLNAAQEVVQPEGDTDFSNVLSKIAEYVDEINVPVYAKEVGHGISFDVAKALKDVGVKAVDVQGAGGTSWTMVDSIRHKSGFGKTFREWGIPTAVSVVETKNALVGERQILASGGIRNGIEGIKSIILGADMVGVAMPILKAQQKSYKSLQNYLHNFTSEMAITSFLLGCKNIEELKKQEYVVLGKLKEWLNQ